MTTLHLTQKMTITTQVVEMSVTSNSLSEDYSHLDDHTRQAMYLMCEMVALNDSGMLNFSP